MIRKATKNNYRKFYKQYYGIDFDTTFEVHHIDSDKNNNDISNLLLLPKELHHEYHMLTRYDRRYFAVGDYMYPDLSKPLFTEMGCGFKVEYIEAYTKMICQVYEWKQHKDTAYSLYRIQGITRTRKSNNTWKQ